MNLPFITWREMPPLHEGAKPRKVPWDSVKGHEASAHDRSLWMTQEQCQAVITANPELRFGVVLSDSDPYFLLDLDDCYDTSTGEWSQGVHSILQQFPNAAVETSINGRGLHILGQCQPEVLGDRRNKFNLYGVECEFYHTGRFLALGHGFAGNADLNWTATLQAIVPTREHVEKLPLIDQADPEWSGPDDDDELVRLMLNARGSTASTFGEKATVADLWNADPETLASFYPSVTGDAFDRSDADGALMAHLAFWTGKNTDRMDRLFRKSGLMRPKYDKHGNYDYAGHTISGAVSITRNVFKQSKKSEPQLQIPLQQPTESVSEIPSAEPVVPDKIYGEIMTSHDQIEYFDGCVYVSDLNSILTPKGYILKSSSFKAMYGGHNFLMSADGTKPTHNAFEAFTENRMIKFPKVKSTRFKPQLPFGSPVAPDGVNIYMPPVIETIEGDVSCMMGLLSVILPNDRDRTILLSWMAAVVQYPGVKFLWSPVVQGVEGNGKSIWGEILHYSVGAEHSWTVEAKKIDSQFNSFLANRILINVEEMNIFAKHELMDTLKGLITGVRQEIEQKGVDSSMNLDYCANWYFATNHKDAVIKSKNDRRFAVFFTAQQTRADLVASGLLDNEYFPRLWNWLRNGGGFAMMRHFLLNYQIPEEFNPATSCFIAPETSSNAEAVSFSYGAAEQYIFEAVEADTVGFKGGWLSTARVTEILADVGIKRTPTKLSAMLEKMGYEARGRSTRPLMHEGNKKPRLYALTGVTGGVDEYEKAQGYTT